MNKAREAIKAIRAMLPRTTVRTRTTAPDGKVIYEDDREVQESRIPLFEGMLHTQTFAPILAARRNATGGRRRPRGRVGDGSPRRPLPTSTDRGPVGRAAKASKANKAEDAAKALAMALVRGVEFRYSKEDTPLASARDAIWLARRSLEENNTAQALVNLEVARQRLRVYRELMSQDQRQEVDQMLREVEQLEGQLRQEGTRVHQPRRAGPPGPHGDAMVGPDQQLVPAAFVISRFWSRGPTPPRLRGPVADRVLDGPAALRSMILEETSDAISRSAGDPCRGQCSARPPTS